MDTTGRLDVTIVGAGLTGPLMAMYLARSGHRVEVFDKRDDPRLDQDEAGRSINLGLSARGMAALREIGLLDRLLDTAVPMYGRMVHGPHGVHSFTPYGTSDHEILYSVRRRVLNGLLVDAAEANPRITFNFGSRLTDLDVDNGIAWFVNDRTGLETTAKADLLVGADGTFSLVRQHLLQNGRVDYSQEYMDWGYKELMIPPHADGSPRVPLNALHIWPGDDGLILGNPNQDGSITCTLFLPYSGANSFTTLSEPRDILDFFYAQFPAATRLMPNLMSQFTRNPVGSLVTVRTSRWFHRDKVVLIGDACHAVWPFYAQGMNAAFEDCSVLDECLRRFPADRESALVEYEVLRRPNTDVLAELAKKNFFELRDGMRSPWFVAKKKADLMLSRLLPNSWAPLYSMVAHTTMPYATAVERARRQDELLRKAAQATGGGAALAAGAVALRAALRVRGSLR